MMNLFSKPQPAFKQPPKLHANQVAIHIHWNDAVAKKVLIRYRHTMARKLFLINFEPGRLQENVHTQPFCGEIQTRMGL